MFQHDVKLILNHRQPTLGSRQKAISVGFLYFRMTIGWLDTIRGQVVLRGLQQMLRSPRSEGIKLTAVSPWSVSHFSDIHNIENLTI